MCLNLTTIQITIHHLFIFYLYCIMSAWTDFATKHYNANKHKPGYSFKMALKEAGKLYKKGTSSSSSSTMKKSRRKGKKSKTARRR
jgi:hypothetical protein